MKIIAVLPVKNDAWFVGNVIEHLKHWADEIIIDDDSSDDGSEEIFRKYNNIKSVHHFIRPTGQSFNTPERRNYMLSLARNFDGNNIIFEIHADEIISAEILKPEIKDKLLNDMKIGTALMLPWVNVWENPFSYRNDNSIWSGNKSWFAFRDDRKVQFSGPTYHGPRVPELFMSNRLEIDYLQVMHYQFINLPMERSKQALYQIYERNHHPNKNIEYINKTYACAFDERQVNLVKLNNRHFQPWIDLNIAIDKEYKELKYNWRDTEVLRNFKKYGIDKYKDLNIWYINWEKKREDAIKLGVEGIYDKQIIDPRDYSTKLAHEFVMKYQLYPFWRVDFYKLLFQKGIEKMNNIVIK